jgi:prepilin peptidase CpaA
MSILLVAAFASLTALLASAVATDLRSQRIPNRLVLIGLAVAFGFHAWALSTGSTALAGARWWTPVAGIAAGGAVLMPLYLLRGCGAGDVKLMAMVGAFVGPVTALWATLCTLLAGGLLSLLIMLMRGVAVQTLINVLSMLAHGLPRSPLQQTAARMPYAVAIALGTLAALMSGPLGRAP